MKKLMTGLLFSAMFAGSAFAAPLPSGTSDRIFATDLAGNVFFDRLIPEGGSETAVFTCGGCTDTAIVLLEAGGRISDIFTLVNDSAGNGIVTFTSDVEGGPSLVAPPNAIFFQETQEPLEITDFVNLRRLGQRLFIQSDVENTAVPEPTSMALVGAGLLALLAGRGRKRAL